MKVIKTYMKPIAYSLDECCQCIHYLSKKFNRF